MSATSQVLILRKDRQSALALSRFCAANHLEASVVDTRGAALEHLALRAPAVLITDLCFDDLSPDRWLRVLGRYPDTALIGTMRPGDGWSPDRKTRQRLFELIDANTPAEQVFGHLRRALQYITLRRRKQGSSPERERFDSQLEWLLWKLNSEADARREQGLAIVLAIRHSLTQGLGLGSLITQSHLLQLEHAGRGGGGESMTRLIASADSIGNWLQNLDTIQKELQYRPDTAISSSDGIARVFEEIALDTRDLLACREHRLFLPEETPEYGLKLAPRALKIILSELILNAMKFSPPRSSIHLVSSRAGDAHVYMCLSDVQNMRGGVAGIPRDMESRIFEPFTRLNNICDERYLNALPGLGSDMGIGLHLVQTLVARVGGTAQVYEIMDYSRLPEPIRRVSAQILLPITHEAAGEHVEEAPSRTTFELFALPGH